MITQEIVTKLNFLDLIMFSRVCYFTNKFVKIIKEKYAQFINKNNLLMSKNIFSYLLEEEHYYINLYFVGCEKYKQKTISSKFLHIECVDTMLKYEKKYFIFSNNLYDNDYIYERLLTNSLVSGRTDIAQYLTEKNNYYNTYPVRRHICDIMQYIIINSHINVINWIEEKYNIKLLNEDFIYAIVYSTPDFIYAIHKKYKFYLNSIRCYSSAFQRSSNMVEILDWLFANNCLPPDGNFKENYKDYKNYKDNIDKINRWLSDKVITNNSTNQITN